MMSQQTSGMVDMPGLSLILLKFQKGTACCYGKTPQVPKWRQWAAGSEFRVGHEGSQFQAVSGAVVERQETCQEDKVGIYSVK